MGIIVLIALMFAILGAQAAVYKLYIFKGIEYSCSFSTSEAYEDDEIYLVETIYNRKPLPIPWMKIELRAPRWLEFGGDKAVLAQDMRYISSGFFLKGYQKTTRRWKVKCLKRGVYKLSNATMIAGDLLGIYMNSVPVAFDIELTVYPRIVVLEDILIAANYLQGDNIVKRWINDDPFVISGVREYSGFDPMNRVHWLSTARTGRLMAKKTDFTSQYGITVLLNIESEENEQYGISNKNIVESGIKLAAALCDMAARTCSVSRLGSNGCIADNENRPLITAEAFGREHTAYQLTMLARLLLKRVRYFDEFLEYMAYRTNNSQIIIISAYISERIVKCIDSFLKSNNSVKIILLDYNTVPKLPKDVDVYYIVGAGDKSA